jgi:hypothetical protein
MEIIGVYDNCWCNADYFDPKANGWVLLFKGASDLKIQAGSIWGGGIAPSIIITLGSFLILALGKKHNR